MKAASDKNPFGGCQVMQSEKQEEPECIAEMYLIQMSCASGC